MRINKYLSECGICSRREADRLLTAGEVTVNGNIAEPGQQVQETDQVCLRGTPVSVLREKTYLKFYKPVGIVCTSERREKRNLTDYLNYPVRVTYAGRLDRESEGLLLLTDDGDLIDALMRARNRHEKEYEVEVNRPVTEDFLKRLRTGIYLKELQVKTRPCQAEKRGENGLRLVLTQGLNRQIRRMCRACGYEVKKLKRVRVANLKLGDLKPGEYRELTSVERQELLEWVKG